MSYRVPTCRKSWHFVTAAHILWEAFHVGTVHRISSNEINFRNPNRRAYRLARVIRKEETII